jgi:hypothetical protein
VTGAKIIIAISPSLTTFEVGRVELNGVFDFVDLGDSVIRIT